MADLSSLDQDGITRTVSDKAPSHYTVVFQLFSQLAKNKVEQYTSNTFEAAGYKWNLVLRPNANNTKGITDHISLYLAIADGNELPPGWEIRAAFRLFLLDQSKDTYLILQDTTENGRRFNRLKRQWGFDKFISHTAFNDSANGYLTNDTCVFGAEVYIRQEKQNGKGESLTMIKDAISHKNTWRIENFSRLTEECVESKPFNAAGYNWKIQLYSKGKGTGSGSHISLYLTLAEPENIPPTTKIYAEFTIRILDQINGKHDSGSYNYWFTASSSTSGWPKFASHSYFYQPTFGFLVKNICLVEAEVKVLGIANDL